MSEQRQDNFDMCRILFFRATVLSSGVRLYSSLLCQGDTGIAARVPLTPIIACQGDQMNKAFTPDDLHDEDTVSI